MTSPPFGGLVILYGSDRWWKINITHGCPICTNESVIAGMEIMIGCRCCVQFSVFASCETTLAWQRSVSLFDALSIRVLSASSIKMPWMNRHLLLLIERFCIIMKSKQKMCQYSVYRLVKEPP